MSANQAKAEMLIRSTEDQVFNAFVDPAVLATFWLEKSSAPLVPGATVQWEFTVPNAKETVTVTAFERPHHLAFDWSDGVHVEMRFARKGEDAAVVTVVASGFCSGEEAVGATEGFSIVLCDLKTLLESGRSANLVRDKASLIGSHR
jgi:uncharacterized protein YndB with AHSA1/START domain